jgi:hypothetical protein
MDDRDFSYFHRRLAEEQAAAERSSDPAVQMVHLRLAERYETYLAQRTGGNGDASKLNGATVPHLMPTKPVTRVKSL